MKFISLLFPIICVAQPTVSITVPPIIRAGKSVTLTANCTGTGGLTYYWQQLSGPAGSFVNRAVNPATLNTSVAGNYNIQVQCTDSISSALALMDVGAVATDSNNVVITGDSTKDKLIGSLLKLGSSPWTYYDIADRALVDTIATAALTNPPHFGTATTGTSAITCSGIDYCTAVGAGTLYTSELSVNDTITLTWDTIDGVNTGRLSTSVKSITNDTQLTLNSYIVQITVPSTALIYKLPGNTATFQPFWWGMAGGAGGTSWNYYDVTLALYRLYYRTGITAYLTYARQFADYWWQWSIDHGRAGVSPRVGALQGQFIRALDGKSERFPDLKTMIFNWLPGGNVQYSLPSDLKGTNLDAREGGYTSWYLALGAMSDPDSTRHTAYCNAIINTTVPKWILWQQPDGYWSEDLYGISGGGYVYKTPGTSPWRTDIPIHGLQASYEVLNNTTSAGCNSIVLAASLLTTITKAVNWTYLAGRSDPALGGNGGVYYDAAYETNGQIPIAVSGTVSINLGSTNVTGVGTSFTSIFGSTGTKYIGFNGPYTMYKVTTSTDDTHLIITPSFGSQGEVSNISGGSYVGANKAFTTCASAAIFCYDLGYWPPTPPNGDRNLTRLMSGFTGWMFKITGITLYKTWADNWFSNAFGGPGNGPGGSNVCTGPNCDGVEGDYKAALPSCVISPNPPTICNNTENYAGGNVYSVQGLGKNFGQGNGAPGSQNWLADRLGGVLPSEVRQFRVSGKISCPGCTKMKVTVTDPSGVSVTTICTSSPCLVTADAIFDSAFYTVDYLNSSDVTINYGTQLRLNF